MSSKPTIATAARSYLFAPGNNEKLLYQVFEAGADAVVLDLEDAVPATEKERARERVARRLAELASSGPDRLPSLGVTSPMEVWVRVNGLENGRTQDDVRAVVSPTLRGIRLPKVESQDMVREVAAWLTRAEVGSGLPGGSIWLDCTIETARGVVHVMEIAAASDRVRALIFGHADYVLDVAASPGPDDLETLYARSALVTASRALGIASPVDGAYTRLRDPEGLRRSVESARRLGYLGKSAIHPEQIAIIHDAFAPTRAEIKSAREVVARYERAAASGEGVLRMEDGQVVDRPVVARAYRILALSERGGQLAEGDTDLA